MQQKSRSLTSAKNPAVQRFRDAAAGRAERLMLAEGVRLVWDAVRAGVEVVEAAVSPKLGDIDLRDALAERSGSFLDVSDSLLQRLSALETPQGVAALLRRPLYDDGALLGDELAPLVVAAAGLRDPGNVGAVVRTAEAAGATTAARRGRRRRSGCEGLTLRRCPGVRSLSARRERADGRGEQQAQ